jgi:hypothetical protein
MDVLHREDNGQLKLQNMLNGNSNQPITKQRRYSETRRAVSAPTEIVEE